MAVQRPVRYSAEYIWETPDDGNRYEVIDGQLYMTPPPLEPHQRGLTGIFGRVWLHVTTRRLGRVYVAPIGVKLDDENGLQPDLIFISNERETIITERGIVGAPDLAVEILSRSTRSRDLGIKMRRYAASGISHYWILDPRTKTLQVYELAGGGYEPMGTYAPGDVFRPRLFPGLKIPIDEIWA